MRKLQRYLSGQEVTPRRHARAIALWVALTALWVVLLIVEPFSVWRLLAGTGAAGMALITAIQYRRLKRAVDADSPG